MAESFNTTALVVPDQNGDPVYSLRIFYIVTTKYLWPFFVIMGLFGNVMSIFITLQKDNRRISTCNYMTALALADSNVLLAHGWGMIWIFWSPDLPSEFAMQGMWYHALAFAILSGFYLAEMTLDRLIVVRYPMSASKYCTTRRACITIITTFILICGLNLYIFFTFRKVIDEVTGEGIMRMIVPHAPELETLGNASQLALGTVFPFCVIVYCNLSIIAVLRGASKERGKMGVSKEGQKTRDKEESHLTRMLILVSIAYVITSIPYRLYDIIIGLKEIKENYIMQEEYWSLRYYSQHYFILQFWKFNFGINFYLYCVGGGKKYRNDVKERLGKLLFCCKEAEHKG